MTPHKRELALSFGAVFVPGKEQARTRLAKISGSHGAIVSTAEAEW